MAKNTFTLTKHEDFTVNGTQGTYKFPPLETLTYNDWKDVVALVRNGGKIPNQIVAYRDFFTKLCPEIEQEGLGENQWLQLGTAYFDYMGK